MALHLVTGAGSGIGADLADRLVDRGEDVIRVTRSEVDLEDRTALTVWASELAARTPSLASLCHVAGAVQLGAVADLDPEAWDRQLAVNLSAPAVLTAALLPALRAGRGTVVFVNSTAALGVNAGWSAYAASKAGLRAFADALRAEEAAAGVRVTSIFPGRTATPMQERVHAWEGQPYDPDRWIRPETVSEAVLGVLDLPSDAVVPEITLRPGSAPRK